MDIALHSMCHPGYPLPQGESQSITWCSNFALGEPQHEVGGILLALVHDDPGARPQLLLVQQGELSVAGEPADVEVHVAARDVGEALRFSMREIRSIMSWMCSVALQITAGEAQRIRLEVAEERLRVEVRDLPDRLALFPRPLQHLVLALVGVPREVADVGDVHHVAHLAAEILEGLSQEVFEDIGAQVADVREVVNGEAAAVHPHLPRGDRDERLHFPAHRVPQLHLHDRSLPSPTPRFAPIASCDAT